MDKHELDKHNCIWTANKSVQILVNSQASIFAFDLFNANQDSILNAKTSSYKIDQKYDSNKFCIWKDEF